MSDLTNGLAAVSVEPWSRRDPSARFFELAPQPMCVVCGTELKIESANHAFQALLDARACVGRRWCDALPHGCGALLAAELHEVVRDATPRCLRQQPIRSSPASAERYWDFALHPLPRAGAVARVAILGSETTEQVSTLRALEGALQRAERSAQLKDELLSELVHELRTPLTSLSAVLRLLADREPHDAQKARRILMRQIEHLLRLFDDLFEVARTGRGSFQLRRERVALADVIEHAIDMAQPQLSARGHAVQVDLAPGLALDADPVRLTQVLCNLITNAAKYTQEGGAITVSARAFDGCVAVAIRDTGSGMAPHELLRVFDKFERTAAAVRCTSDGLGIGLHVARMLVHQHGGRIEAHSDGHGQGSEFKITLPAAAQL